jgi:hypothetical protein
VGRSARGVDTGTSVVSERICPTPHRHPSFGSDVRLVSSDQRAGELGFHRGTCIVWLPSGVALHVWEHGLGGMPDDVADLFRRRALLRSTVSHASDAPTSAVISNERNSNFLSAIANRPCRDDRGLLHENDVIIVGCGGVGSNLAVILGSFGFQRIMLIDGDIVEDSNLNRLTWATAAMVGKPKVQVLQAFLREKFGLSVATVPTPADAYALKEIAGASKDQFIVLALDDGAAVRNLVSELHRGSFMPYVQAGYSGPLCIVGPIVNTKEDACPFCDNHIEVAITSRFVAPSAAPNNLLVASFLASQLLVNAGGGTSPLLGKRWLFDLVSGNVTWQPVSKNSFCRVCA